MGWDAVVFGELELDRDDGVARWLGTSLDPNRLRGAAECLGANRTGVRTVGALLDELRAWDRQQSIAFVRVTVDDSGERVRVRAFLPEEDYRTWALPLALAFEASARLGGKGQLCFAGFLTSMFEHQVIVDGRRALLRTLDDLEILELEERPELHELRVAIAERSASTAAWGQAGDWDDDCEEQAEDYSGVRTSWSPDARVRMAPLEPSPQSETVAKAPLESIEAPRVSGVRAGAVEQDDDKDALEDSRIQKRKAAPKKKAPRAKKAASRR